MMIPNGQMSVHIGQRLKDMGQLKGAPDLLIAVPSANYHGLFIEMKATKGRLTPEQKEVHKELLAQGYDIHVCYSDQEAMQVTQNYLIPPYAG